MSKQKHLPHILGFSTRDDGVLGPLRIPPETEHAMATVLCQTRFQRGKVVARVYANLVVLFRLLLYYADLRDHDLFWFWIRVDWGLTNCGDGSSVDPRTMTDYFVRARTRGCFGNEQRRSLLARLVDAWRQDALRMPRGVSGAVSAHPEAEIATRRNCWRNLRDNHVDVLMDSKQPACLLGVDLPQAKVTSLWEKVPDPVMAELMGSPHQLQVNNRIISDVYVPHPNSTGAPPANKRRKESKPPAPKRRRTMGDLPDNIQLPNALPVRVSGESNIGEWDRDILRSSPPREVRNSFTQPIGQAFQSQLDSISQSLQKQEREVAARVERETTGYVPTASQTMKPREQADPEPTSFDKAACESRVCELEDRVAVLEKRLMQDSDWARSIGTFLYDANEKTLATFRELFGTVGALKDLLGGVLEDKGRLGP